MATHALLKSPVSTPAEPPRQHSLSSLALLSDLHAEAVATTRLGKLMPRSLIMAASLACLTGFVLADSFSNLTANLAWAALVMCGAAAILCCYSKAAAQPVHHESLEKYARTLAPVSLYCGLAWGLGAFMVLPGDTGLADAALFVGAPIVFVAFALRERALILAFVMPMLLLSSFAALLRPLPDATLMAALMLLTGASLLVPMIFAFSRQKRAAQNALPRLPTFAA